MKKTSSTVTAIILFIMSICMLLTIFIPMFSIPITGSFGETNSFAEKYEISEVGISAASVTNLIINYKEVRYVAKEYQNYKYGIFDIVDDFATDTLKTDLSLDAKEQEKLEGLLNSKAFKEAVCTYLLIGDLISGMEITSYYSSVAGQSYPLYFIYFTTFCIAISLPALLISTLVFTIIAIVDFTKKLKFMIKFKDDYEKGLLNSYTLYENNVHVAALSVYLFTHIFTGNVVKLGFGMIMTLAVGIIPSFICGFYKMKFGKDNPPLRKKKLVLNSISIALYMLVIMSFAISWTAQFSFFIYLLCAVVVGFMMRGYHSSVEILRDRTFLNEKAQEIKESDSPLNGEYLALTISVSIYMFVYYGFYKFGEIKSLHIVCVMAAVLLTIVSYIYKSSIPKVYSILDTNEEKINDVEDDIKKEEV